MTETLAPANVSVRIVLTDRLAEKYQQQAVERGMDIESVILERLQSCVSHTSPNALYFSDRQRQELEQIVKTNIKGAPDFLNFCRRFFQINLSGIKMQLDPLVLERLRTRMQGTDTFGAWLSEQVNKWAAQFVGLG